MSNLRNRYGTSNYKVTTPFNQKNKGIIIQLLNGRPHKLNQRRAYSSDTTIEAIGNQNVNDSGKPISLLSAQGNKAKKQATQAAVRETSPLTPVRPTIQLSRSIQGLANTPSRGTISPIFEQEFVESRPANFNLRNSVNLGNLGNTAEVVVPMEATVAPILPDRRATSVPPGYYPPSPYLAQFRPYYDRMDVGLKDRIERDSTIIQTNKTRINNTIDSAESFAKANGITFE